MRLNALALACAIIIACVAAACATQSPYATPNPNQTRSANTRSANDCFNVNFLTGYESVDSDTIRANAGSRDHYELDISGPQCNQINWTHRVALTTSSG